jgi:hypothetical protein
MSKFAVAAKQMAVDPASRQYHWQLAKSRIHHTAGPGVLPILRSMSVGEAGCQIASSRC